MLTRGKQSLPAPARNSSAANTLADASGTESPEIQSFARSFQSVVENVEKVIRGKTEAIHLALVAFFSEGHLLIEDVPGVGKTSLARCIAASVRTSCHRIQFTADLLPTDVTGGMVYDPRTGAFSFREGPVFANIVVGDEINRASPKAQSALLEVMEERRVTADGQPHPVPSPFMVVATQNPIDMEGTYPLPEAQLDRFMLRISIGHPDPDAEIEMMQGRRSGVSPEDLEPVLSGDEVKAMMKTVRGVDVQAPVYRYIAQIMAATRAREELLHGASPRGSIAMLRASQARAASLGRNYVNPDDVKALAVHVLAHRVVLSPAAELSEKKPARVIDDVVATVDVPKGFDGR